MNWAIWKKAVSDAWLQLAVSCVFLLLFVWVFMWMISQIPNRGFVAILRWLPDWVEPIVGVPLAELGSPTGQLSLMYVHVITLLVCVGWAVGRGSDSISGEIGRGTLDLLLSLPIRRATFLVAPAVLAALGAAILPAAILLGTFIGLHTIDFGEKVSLWRFLPGSINLCCLIIFLTGVTTFLSAFNANRWRTISMAAGFYVLSVIIGMIGKLWDWGAWLEYLSFATAYQPHLLILKPEHTGLLAWQYNVPLVAMGLVGYAAAAVVLSYRDIPAAK